MSNIPPRRSPRKPNEKKCVLSVLRNSTGDDKSSNETEDEDAWGRSSDRGGGVAYDRNVVVPTLPPMKINIGSSQGTQDTILDRDSRSTYATHGTSDETTHATSSSHGTSGNDSSLNTQSDTFTKVDKGFLPRGRITDSHCIERLTFIQAFWINKCKY